MKGYTMKIGDKIKTLVWHNGIFNVDAIIVDIDRNLVCVAYIVNGKRLWGWVPSLAIER